MKLAIVVAATKSYLYAFPQCLRSIAAAATHHAEAHFVFVTDESEEGKQAEHVARDELPSGWKITTLRLNLPEDEKNYKKTAQLRIAALQGAGFAFARTKVRADVLWSVESDNIVPANALRALEWTLAMPNADGSPYYDIAAATYPNGLFLGGFGMYQSPIEEDFLPHERKLPPRLKLCFEECGKRLKSETYASDKERARMTRWRADIRKHPPDGNVWEVNGKYGWRRRGWMEFAYPGVGEGAVVPSDWCGLGCTLMSKKALAMANFVGYDGGGTQDLFLCWQRWHPAGLRIACVPHVVCDHVKKEKVKDAEGEKECIIHYRAYHETDPSHRGHLRVRKQTWTPV
jgi:hypothetical protein